MPPRLSARAVFPSRPENDRTIWLLTPTVNAGRQKSPAESIKSQCQITTLLPHTNKKYEAIRPKSRLVVEGVVSSVIRKLV